MNIFDVTIPQSKKDSTRLPRLLVDVNRRFHEYVGPGYNKFSPFIYDDKYIAIVFPINNDEWSAAAFKLCAELAQDKTLSVTHNPRLLEGVNQYWSEQHAATVYFPALFYFP